VQTGIIQFDVVRDCDITSRLFSFMDTGGDCDGGDSYDVTYPDTNSVKYL
jgi:hypothetical protein